MIAMLLISLAAFASQDRGEQAAATAIPPPPPMPGLEWAAGMSLSELKHRLGSAGEITRLELPVGSDGVLEYSGGTCTVIFVLKRAPSDGAYRPADEVFSEFAVPITASGIPIPYDRVTPCLADLNLTRR